MPRSMPAFVAVFVMILGLVVSTASMAAKGGSGGGKPGGNPAPSCSDQFPSFVYIPEQNKFTSPAIYLSSADGCRQEKITDIANDVFEGPVLHLSADGTKGVIVWVENPDGLVETVRRVNFSVAADGTLNVGHIETLAMPQAKAKYVGYGSPEVWGNADHSSLYLVISRFETAADQVTLVDDRWLIYNLNASPVNLANDVRTIWSVDSTWRENNSWTCPSSATYQQFVPTCYRLDVGTRVKWNPAGTHLYFYGTSHDNLSWTAGVRLNIDQSGALSSWPISGPELVYAAGNDPAFTQPEGATPRPKLDPADTTEHEYIAMGYIDESGNNAVGVSAILDADLCAQRYADYSGGTADGGDALWADCINPAFDLNGLPGGIRAWASPDALITVGGNKPHAPNIYRAYVSGAMAGTSELLIQGGWRPDTGY